MPEDVMIPEGWSSEALAQCVDVLDNMRKPINSKERSSRIGNIPYFGATGQVGWIDDYLFDEQLVLVGEDGAPFFDKSKPIAYLIEGKTWVNNHAHVLRAKSGVTSNRYIKHYLDSFEFTDYVQGSTRDKLTQGSMNAIPVLLAPLAEQERIVKILDGSTRHRESAQSHLAAARRAIERFRQAVLIAGCSGRLTVKWRDEHPDAYEATPDTVIESDVESLTETPSEWTWCRLEDIADIRGGIQKGAKTKAGMAMRSVPYLRVANVQRGWLDLTEMKEIEASEAKIAQLRLEPGDLLFNEGGDRDKLGRGWIWEGQISECIHQNHVFRARLNDPEMEPKFFSWYGNTIGAAYFLAQGKQTVNLASLNITSLKVLPVPVPLAAEQAEIVRRVDQLLSVADEVEKKVDHAASRIGRSSQAALAKAFRGEIVGT